MQKYPGGGYKEHYHVEEVVEDFSFKDDYHYNKGSSMQMMKPGNHFSPQVKHNYNNHNVHGYQYDDRYDNFKEGHDGYTVQYSEARYEKEQYGEPWTHRNSEARYEKEQYGEPWNHRNDYPGHGGKHHDAYKYQSNAPYSEGGFMGGEYTGGGCTGGGYGGHHGPKHHQIYGEQKPFWNPKSIRD